jgi:hypothetical protein
LFLCEVSYVRLRLLRSMLRLPALALWLPLGLTYELVRLELAFYMTASCLDPPPLMCVRSGGL